MGTPAPGKEVAELDLDNLKPEDTPGIGISDAIKWLPIIEKIVDGVKWAISGGAFTVPKIRVRVFGHRLGIGPVPIALED